VIVVWRVTERCNLACGFCAYDRRLARPRADAEPGAVLAFGGRTAAYQRRTGDQVLVSWLGGEPLLWRPLAGLTAALTGELGLRVSVTTNGTALASPAVRAHLLEHYSEVTVSVDGFAPCTTGCAAGRAASRRCGAPSRRWRRTSGAPGAARSCARTSS
jgi:MoaA/NifB/PqqE/SkfB family radical SAM enzyme